MDADYDIFEIVAVIRDFWHVDAESYQRSYCTNDGKPLSPAIISPIGRNIFGQGGLTSMPSFMVSSNYVRMRMWHSN
jgi:hypothetical protein